MSGGKPRSNRRPRRRTAESVSYGRVKHLFDLVSGRVAVGCVWSEFLLGHRYLLFRATAATTRMSLLFAQSFSVRDTFATVGREAGASLVGFDDEQGELVGVWPRQGQAGSFVIDMYAMYASLEPDGERIDSYCAATLAVFGLGPSG